MTYALLFRVTSTDELNRAKSIVQSVGYTPYPDIVSVGGNSYLAVLFAGKFSTIKKWATDINLPVYVYEDDVAHGQFDASKLKPANYNDRLDLRYSYSPPQEKKPASSVCSICGTPIEYPISGITDASGNVICIMCSESWKSCSLCGLRHPVKSMVTYNRKKICNECWETHSKPCNTCGKRHLPDKLFPVESVRLCSSCISDTTIVGMCSACGSRRFVRSLETDRTGRVLCNRCARSYARCSGCGMFISPDDQHHPHDELDGSVWCDECERPRQFFGSFRYVPTLKFYDCGDGDKSTVVGLEIEMSGGEKEQLLTELKNFKEIWFKRDGSINGSGGMEMVTHPCSYNYMMTKFQWESLLNKCISLGYVSHKDESCGLHIHIDRHSFEDKDDPNSMDANILRMVWIITKFWPHFVRFSRRSQASMDRWAARYGNIINDEIPNGKHIDHMKSLSRGHRYMCVNLQPRNTVELRFFRGSLNLETVLASIQLCDVLVNLKTVPMLQIYEMNWETFFNRCKDYPELMSYMARRGITEEDKFKDVDLSEPERVDLNERTWRSLNEMLGRQPQHPPMTPAHIIAEGDELPIEDLPFGW